MEVIPGPNEAHVANALGTLGRAMPPTGLPEDLGSINRQHVYVFEDVVVKFDLSPEGHRTLRECASLQLLAGSDLPVPRLLGSGQWDGPRRWLTMTRLAGHVPEAARQQAHRSDPELARQMGAATARLHTGPRPPAFGAWSFLPTDLLSDHRQMNDGVGRMARNAGLLPARELDALIDLLEHSRSVLESAPAEPVLSHRDMQARNILVDDSGQLAALLDFETSGGGDPAEDFSRFGLDWEGETFAAFCLGYAQGGGRLDADAPERIAYHVLRWALVIFAYVGLIRSDYLDPARTAWARVEAGELPRLGPCLG